MGSRILCLWLFVSLPVWAVDPPRLPNEVTGQPGEFVQVPATTENPNVKWYSPDSGLNVFPVHLLRDSKTAVVTASAVGRFRLIAWTAKGDEPSGPAVCTVVIGDAPEPTPPGPGPGPTPPEPTDPFARDLQALYAAESNPQKSAHLASLTELYRQYAQTVRDSQLTTAGQLYSVLANASKRLLPADALRPMRERLRVELEKTLPTDAEAKLDERIRQEAQSLFSHIAAVLEGVK